MALKPKETRSRYLIVLAATLLLLAGNVKGDIRMRFREKRRCSRSLGIHTDEEGKVKVYSQVKKRHLVKLHYNASIDASSQVGTTGQEVENTRRAADGTPIELIVGVGQTGWDIALVNLCVGDKADLVVMAPDAPYGIERFRDNVPRGATVRVTMEIVSTEPSTAQLRDHDTFLFSSADSNDDGRLSSREFLFYFKDRSARIGSSQYRKILRELEALFHELDKNKDKALTMDEFTFRKTSVHSHTGLEPRDEFDFYDDNRDGKLNKKEIEGYFKAIKLPTVPMDYWKHVDKNRNGYISFEEFTKDAYSQYSSEL